MIGLIDEKDIPQVYQFLNTVAKETDYLMLDEHGLNQSLLEFQHTMLQQLKKPKIHFLGYKINHKLVGLANYRIYPKKKMAHRATIALSVLAAYHNQGIGQQLLTELINHAKLEANLELLELEVACENQAAIHLYKKVGFKEVGLLPKFFKMDTRYLDFVKMQLAL